MLRKCPSHGLAPGRDLVKFYQGLNNESMRLINASTDGDLDNKTHEEVRTLFQKLADNQRNWYNPRRVVEKKGNTFGASVESERMAAVEAQLANISTQMTSVVKAVSSMQLNPQPQIVAMVKCGLCQGGHHTDQCEMIQSQETVENVNYIGNNRQGFSQGGQFNNNHQNWTPQQQGNWNQWRNNSQPPGFDKKPSQEDQMEQIFTFMSKSKKENDFFKEKTIEKFGQLEASMRNLETQIGQLAAASHTRTPGTIPSDTVPNPKGNEHFKAVTLRSGRNLDSKLLMDDQEPKKSKSSIPNDIPPPPYPLTRKKRVRPEKSFEWMMNVIRKVNVDISLVDLFTNFLRFSKFFKDIMVNKEKLQDEGIVALSTNCS
ncbi:uncharacterized protein LOC121804200 [Salvia splendens]|uniref:uncharacterized protein LOC121804200 n=1 Tax=Salvia splendens TaxID=180675 RepID=UPI001C2546DF|nr:uncharacterized protein LOC121804200 [Salvia splendens]